MTAGFSVGRPVTIDTSVLTSSNVAETETLWVVGTTYALGAAVYRVIDGIHRRYVSLQNSNTGHTPEEVGSAWWEDQGATTRWAMFDDASTSLTTRAESISVVMTMPATSRVDTLYLQFLAGVSVRVQVTSLAAVLLHDETYSLADPGGITDWLGWLDESVRYRNELLVTGLPRTAGCTFTVTISHPGDTAACGNLVAAFRKFIGVTRWGVETSIRDYSVIQENDFGNRVVVERPYRKLASGDILIENRVKDSAEQLLAEGRAVPRLYVFDEGYTTLAIFGLVTWRNRQDLPPKYCTKSIQIEGNA